MIILGLILLLVGHFVGISLLVTIGWIVLLIGLVLLALSFVPSGPFHGRRFY